MKSYSCPECHADIPLADMNVAADVALCRACGTRSHIADLIEEGDEAEEMRRLSDPVPKHVEVVREMDDISGRVELRYRKFNAAVLFLIPFTLVWSGFSLGGIYGTQICKHAFDWKISLFGIPFLIGTFVLVGTICTMLFAKRRLVLERGRGTYSTKTFGIGRTHAFDLSHETEFSVDETAFRSRDGIVNFAIRVKNGNVSESVCTGWDEDALHYALAMMKRHRV